MRHLSRFTLALGSVTWLGVGSLSATIINGGNVINQTWTPAGSPYIVQGDVTVPNGAFLTIQAGTSVQFATTDSQAGGLDTARVEMTINGTLNVTGTAGSPVTFRAQVGSAASIWYGIVINSSAVAASIGHASIQHARYGIQSQAIGTALQVNYTTIDRSVFGVQSVDGSPSFDAVQTSGCSTGFDFSARGTPSLTNVISQQNAVDGISVVAGTGNLTASVTNATLHNNGNAGLRVISSPGSMATVTVKNAVITTNFYGVYRDVFSGPVSVTYSDVWNNLTNFVNVAPGVGVISTDPSYVGGSNLHVTAGSTVIDTGNNSGSPTHDYDGVSRPLDGDGIGGAVDDMGAYEFAPAVPPAPGTVPETAGGPQPLLTASTPDHGVTLALQWGASCGNAVSDYAVYQGALGNWYSHLPVVCTTSGGLTASFAPFVGNAYYLVVPLSATEEGIYGHTSEGGPIPPSSSPCRAILDSTPCP